MEGHMALLHENRNAYRVLVGKLEGTRPIGSRSGKREDNIDVDLKERGWEGVD